MLDVFAVHVRFGLRLSSLYALYMLLACSACVPTGGLLTEKSGGAWLQWWDMEWGP